MSKSPVVQQQSDDTPVIIPVKAYKRKIALFCLLGLINNISGVVILSTAKSLSEDFDKPELMGLLYYANIALGLIAKIVNLAFLLKVSTSLKMAINFAIMLSGLVIVAVGAKVGFEVALGGILLIGASSSFGESVLMGFFKHYSPELIGVGWGSGTGLAGVAGTALVILLKSILELSNFTVYCMMIPLSIIYYGGFLTLSIIFAPKTLLRDYRPEDELDDELVLDFDRPLLINEDSGPDEITYEYDPNLKKLVQVDKSHIQAIGTTKGNMSLNAQYSHEAPNSPRQKGSQKRTNFDQDMDTSESFMVSNNYGTLSDNNNILASSATSDSTDSLLRLQQHEEREKQRLIAEFEEQQQQRDSFCQQFCRVSPIMGWDAFMLAMIYFLEYVIISLYASHSNPTEDGKKYDWAYENGYEILSFCYQIGVLFSRSSISWFKFPKTWILTLTQAFNFGLWLAHVELLFLTPVYVQFPLMVFVGCMAGLCYSNTFYNIQVNKELKKDKEFAINVASIGINIGIMSSSFFTLLADATFLKHKHK